MLPAVSSLSYFTRCHQAVHFRRLQFGQLTAENTLSDVTRGEEGGMCGAGAEHCGK